ncbi:hypothetical protein JOF57_002559 [Mycolicibacterium lutetiense]|uniref:Uncharacterized protein n=1 Tax=Mycolicibacterium lutetiense TaxID=1641992 RepID=A0ABS4ZT16_9MYCO|nr:hypothetical protein [Mycolicibacterium lutetiense]
MGDTPGVMSQDIGDGSAVFGGSGFVGCHPETALPRLY